jgi:hypothetical protein
MSLRLKRTDQTNLRAAAQLAQQSTTCEGCCWLQRHPRPQCKGETSPYYRMVRDTHYPQCSVYARRKPGDPSPVKA